MGSTFLSVCEGSSVILICVSESRLSMLLIFLYYLGVFRCFKHWTWDGNSNPYLVFYIYALSRPLHPYPPKKNLIEERQINFLLMNQVVSLWFASKSWKLEVKIRLVVKFCSTKCFDFVVLKCGLLQEFLLTRDKEKYLNLLSLVSYDWRPSWLPQHHVMPAGCVCKLLQSVIIRLLRC
jgi:hypothetical protein